MPPTADTWARLGALLEEQRGRIEPNAKKFAKRTGLNYRLIYDLEHARRTNYRAAKLAEVEQAYELPRGSIRRFLESGDPQALFPDDEAAPYEDGLALTAEELEDEHVQVIMSIPDVPKNILIPYAKKAYQLRQEQRRRAHEHHRRREAG